MPPVHMQQRSAADAFLFEPGLRCHTTGRLVGNRMPEFDAMEAGLAQSPISRCRDGPRSDRGTARQWHHPVGGLSLTAPKVQGLERHSAEHSVVLAIGDSPVHCGLIPPALLPLGDPLPGFVLGICPSVMPPLDRRILKRLHHRCGVLQPSGPQKQSALHWQRRLTGARKTARGYHWRDKERHERHHPKLSSAAKTDRTTARSQPQRIPAAFGHPPHDFEHFLTYGPPR